jgi:hypothetical protein
LADPDGTAQPTVETRVPLEDRTIPVLSEEDIADARKIALSDPELSRLSQGTSPEIGDVAVWHSSSGAKLGAVLTVRLQAPYTGEATFLTMDYHEPSYERLYANARYRATIDGLNELRMFVDLRTDTVAKFEPTGNPTLQVIDSSELQRLPIRGTGSE